MNVLYVMANPKPGAEARSRQLADAFFQVVKAKRPDVQVTELDLYANPPPFLDYATYRHFWYPAFNPGYQASEQEKAAAQYARKQGELFNQADVLVIMTPLWNFGMPAILKAWLDQVLIPNVTYTLDESGIKGLHHIRKAAVLVSSGGVYEPGDPRDGIRSGLRAVLGVIGITDIEVAWSQGQNPFLFKDSAERHRRAVWDAMQLGEAVARL